jgi:ankyrin repeat protein
MKAKRFIQVAAITAVVLLALVGGCMLRFPPDPLVYCQKVLDGSLEQWMAVNRTDIRPNADGNGRKSLALLAEYMPKSYAEGVLRDYGYVPGLKENDPNDLVMIYLKKKTRRTWNGDHSASLLREPKWMVIGPDFGFDLPEGGRLENTQAFKVRLLRTLQFLKENDRPYWKNVEKEQMEFLASIGESGISLTDIQQVKEAKEKSERAEAEKPHIICVGGEPKTWRYALTGKDGNAVLDLEGVVLVFAGIPFDGLCTGSLQLAGGGTCYGSTGCGHYVLRTSYANGEASLSFEGHTFKFLDEGRTAVLGDQKFLIGDERPTLVIAKDGTAKMTEKNPNKTSEPAAPAPPQVGGATAMQTALHEAIDNEDLDAVKKCIAARVDLRTEHQNWLPLQRSVKVENLAIVKLLVEAGADINQDMKGVVGTPLQLASGLGNKEIVMCLLSHNADINAPGEFATAMGAAAFSGQLDVVNILLGAGANPAATNRGGKTALRMAAEAEQDAVGQLLGGSNTVGTREEEAQLVYEAVLRDDCRGADTNKVYFVSVDGGDPTVEILAKLNDLGLDLRKCSELSSLPENILNFRDPRTKRSAVILKVTIENWAKDTEAKIKSILDMGGLGGGGYSGTAKKQYGKWFVYRDGAGWVY